MSPSRPFGRGARTHDEAVALAITFLKHQQNRFIKMSPSRPCGRGARTHDETVAFAMTLLRHHQNMLVKMSPSRQCGRGARTHDEAVAFAITLLGHRQKIFGARGLQLHVVGFVIRFRGTARLGNWNGEDWKTLDSISR